MKLIIISVEIFMQGGMKEKKRDYGLFYVSCLYNE